MPVKIMEDIRVAEEEADNIIKNAQIEARNLLKACKDACTVEEKNAEKDAQALYQQLMADRQSAVRQSLDIHQAALDKGRQDYIGHAEKNLPKALETILQRVVRYGHR